jgi:type I restriction enzyme S subunit
LRRTIQLVRRPVSVLAAREYREIGIRSWGKGIFHKEPVKGKDLEDKGIFRIEPGDFVLNIVFAWEGAVAVASESEEGMVGSHRFPTFRHDKDRVDLDYLLMFLQSEQGRALMGLNSPGAAGRNRTIRLGAFLSEEVPLPPLRLQRRMVEAYREQEESLHTLRVEVRAAVERLSELRVAIISAAVTGKIDVRNEVA